MEGRKEAGVGRGVGGGGGGGFRWPCHLGGGGGAKGPPPIYWSQQGGQPTACTLALWWLDFGPTGALQTLQALLRAEGVPLQGRCRLKVRIHQPAGEEGRQDGRRCPQRVVEVEVEVPPAQLGGGPVARHLPHGVVPEDPVEGRLGGDAVRHLGMQGIRPRPQAHQDMTPAGGVPQGLGEGVRLVPGRPFGGQDLPGGEALANEDTHPLGWRIPNALRDSKGAPKKACHPEAPAWACITCGATAVRRVSNSAPRPRATWRPCASAGARP